MDNKPLLKFLKSEFGDKKLVDLPGKVAVTATLLFNSSTDGMGVTITNMNRF